MAWENAVIENFTTGAITGDIANISETVSPQSKQANGDDYFANFGFIESFKQSDYINATIDDRSTIFGTLELGLSIIRTSKGFISLEYPYYIDGQFSGYRTLKNWSRSAINSYSSYQHNCSIFCTINEESHTGTIISYSIDFNSGYWNRLDHSIVYAVELTNTELAYNIIKANEYVQYTWQSVPSISGKNGILSLVTLDSESINDGEPVSGAALSVFDQNPVSGNNVKDIVDGNTPIIPSAVDVTAAFIISNPPVGELASRILAAKKGSIPESIEDADKTISIPANASNVTMPGLDENSKYYFVIFVADAIGNTAVSDPKDCMTGEKPIVPSPEIIQIITKPLSDGYEEIVTIEESE